MTAGYLTEFHATFDWLDANRPMHGDAVHLTDGYAWWWLYVGHFIRSPFYCYAYAFGELLVLALVQKHKEEGASFVPKYLELLSAGGSDYPYDLVKAAGVDLASPAPYRAVIARMNRVMDEIEAIEARRNRK